MDGGDLYAASYECIRNAVVGRPYLMVGHALLFAGLAALKKWFDDPMLLHPSQTLKDFMAPSTKLV